MIPKIISQIWIGPVPEPIRWTRTWARLNPDWRYVMFGNKELYGRKWRNQRVIDHYLAKCEEVEETGEFVTSVGSRFSGEKATLFAWHVIADVMRYEILHEIGGFMPGADTECLKPIPADAFGGAALYCVRTGNRYVEQHERLMQKLINGGFTDPRDAVRFSRYDPLNAAPVMAAEAGHEFLGAVIEEIGRKSDDELGEAVNTTGNVLMGQVLRRHPEKARGLVMPNFLNERESAAEDVWRVHHAGTTHNTYRFAR